MKGAGIGQLRSSGKWGKKIMMDQLPAERNCKEIYFVLDRRRRQWYKCCNQPSPAFLPISKFKCIEAVPTAYFPARDKYGYEMKWDKEEAQMCFRTTPQNCWNGGAFCHDNKEDCVVLGGQNENSKWPETVNNLLRPPAYVYWLQSPSPLFAVAASTLHASLPMQTHGGSHSDAPAAHGKAAVHQPHESWQEFLCGPSSN
jgi:hypothetical protein